MIHANLKWFGAALVAEFCVEKDFRAKDKFFYNGTATFGTDENEICTAERHAMVLVGAGNFEFEGKVDYCLLLQNSHRGKQYVLVTLEYFKSCNGVLAFPPEEILVGPENNLVEAGDRIVESANMGGDDTTGSPSIVEFYDYAETMIRKMKKEGM